MSVVVMMAVVVAGKLEEMHRPRSRMRHDVGESVERNIAVSVSLSVMRSMTSNSRAVIRAHAGVCKAGRLVIILTRKVPEARCHAWWWRSVRA